MHRLSINRLTYLTGSYGLKSELHDVAELVDEVSLGELLDGSHRYSKLYPDKGKKTGHVNENTLALVRRACDLLTSHAANDSNIAKKSPASNVNLNDCLVKISDVDGIHKCVEESLSSKVSLNSLVLAFWFLFLPVCAHYICFSLCSHHLACIYKSEGRGSWSGEHEEFHPRPS